MNDNVSEIDDPSFFLADNGNLNPKDELLATIDAFYNDKQNDDNSTICRFPARYKWLKEQLNADDFPQSNCLEYDKIFKRVNPNSITMVFPSAHINSPASMFGHTFLRINSSYNSKLLSYAINYAANADSSKENGVTFALKGLFGGYFGKYSLLPYYDKLKEYRDSEQRDIWEYDLNFTKKETEDMFRHIWELNGTQSYYYFFTENCSYNMLWLLEVARPTLQLRDKFLYQVIPLETVHLLKEKNLITAMSYRASIRSILLNYENSMSNSEIQYSIDLVEGKISTKKVSQSNVAIQKKRYIFESAIEFLEYQYTKGKIEHKLYLKRFHDFTSARSKLGLGKKVLTDDDANPLFSHRATLVESGIKQRDTTLSTLLGFRLAYHNLDDSDYGFLRGTQIEFFNLLLSYNNETKDTHIDTATLLSIISLTQRTQYFKNFSWRMKLEYDNSYLDMKHNYIADVGAGYSWGNSLAYLYFLVDPMLYISDKAKIAINGSVGLTVDKYKIFTTNAEFSHRFYDTGESQNILKISQGFRVSQNVQISLKYNALEKTDASHKYTQESYQAFLRYYF
jgi:hypothetical protein